MNLRDPTHEEMGGVHELARLGRDEAEERRLIALGRRAEAVLTLPDPPEELAGLRRLWAWFRGQFMDLSAPGSLATGGINPAEELEGDDCGGAGTPAVAGLSLAASNYRLAASLDQLRRQINALAPKRSKKSDGWIGDAAHAARSSDHNPWVKDAKGIGVVTAIDITHDPAGGMDCSGLALLLTGYAGAPPLTRAEGMAGLADPRRGHHDPRIKYVIWNGRICSSEVEPWTWRVYHGKNPHNHHLHISVKPEPELYDDVEPWAL